MGGQPFRMTKFRTMKQDAESDGQARWSAPVDPRVTHVGRLLRRSRLDELPNLLAVLRGEMSMVGPRPERPESVEQLEREVPLYRARLTVAPGLTGWAQVNSPYGGSVEDAILKLEYDLYYINRSVGKLLSGESGSSHGQRADDGVGRLGRTQQHHRDALLREGIVDAGRQRRGGADPLTVRGRARLESRRLGRTGVSSGGRPLRGRGRCPPGGWRRSRVPR